MWELVYRVSPALLGGCRGVSLVPHLEAAGFRDLSRRYVTELGFPSEIITAHR
ncbi:MAG: hypothetical protein HYV09_34985 [Deltaproteobacteria bacterium]|nr:hypothetical protein [Deltaproteobacteria bacterium]